jgi:hypothetical protein
MDNRGVWVAFAIIGLIIVGVFVVALPFHPSGHATQTSQMTSPSSANDSSAGSSLGQRGKALALPLPNEQRIVPRLQLSTFQPIEGEYCRQLLSC